MDMQHPSFGDHKPLRAGDTVGPYRLELMLGEGGMGQVFRARRDDGQLVALKVMKPSMAGKEQMRRFLREARAAGEVDHPRLVGVLDSGEADGQPYIAMRLVVGRSLDERIKEDGPLSIPETVRIVRHVADALEALHRVGLVHRDIKPSNVMLDQADGSASVTDFGLARGGDYSALTKPGQVLGTLDYLAPEAFRGAPPTPALDIYALGCVVFECLAGEPPFAGKGMMQVCFAHLEETPRDPCAGRRDAPPELGKVVNYALAKEPEKRPRTALAYATILAAAAAAAR